MEKREDRRARTFRHGSRVKTTRLRVCNRDYSDFGPSWMRPGAFALDAASRSPLGFAKAKALGCGCLRKKRGNPKVSTSCGTGCGYHETVVERIEGSRICRRLSQVVRAGGDPDDSDF